MFHVIRNAGWMQSPRKFLLFLWAFFIRLRWKAHLVLHELRGHPEIRPVWGLPPTHSSVHKRALVVYSTEGMDQNGNVIRPGHQFHLVSRGIVNALRSLGYEVDVADLRDLSFSSKKDYALIVSHDHHLSPERVPAVLTAYCVYIASGLYPQTQNQRNHERLKFLKERRTLRYEVDLRLSETERPFIRYCRKILVIANPFEPNEWQTETGVECIPIPNVLFDSSSQGIPSKEPWERRKRRILYAGSQGQLMKGLDLTLETAALLPEFEFTICSGFWSERGFRKEYSRELFSLPNVLPLGWLPPHSSLFRRMIGAHAFHLFPTAAEGACGGVIHLSSQGNLPIIAKTAGVDCSGFGFWLEEIHPQALVHSVRAASEISEEEYSRRSRIAREYCQANFSAQTLERILKENFQLIEREMAQTSTRHEGA